MDASDLKFSNAHEVYEKLIEVAQKLNVLSPFNAADNTIEFIHSQLDSTSIIPENVHRLREQLLKSQSDTWANEEKLILFAHFLLSFSLKTSILRFLQFSTKSNEEVRIKLKVLATIYSMLFQYFSLLNIIYIGKIVYYSHV